MAAEHIERRAEREAQPRARSPHAGRYLDLKAVRLAVHGWWLGNPLVYKPDVADLSAVARELAEAGAASGTLILSDTLAPGADTVPPEATRARPDLVRAVVVLRPALPRATAGLAAAVAIAEVAENALSRPCVVRGHWDVALHDDGPALRMGGVTVDEHEAYTLLELRLNLGAIWAARPPEQASASLFVRPDWAEVCVARMLHALDRRLTGRPNC